MEKKACVTGGAGYIGSALVKLLLQNGYTVHATLRNLEDESKVGLLKSIAASVGGSGALCLFEADMYKPQEFERAIQGCELVFHVATPLGNYDGVTRSISRVEATLEASKEIVYSCIKSGTVKRLIYTSSVVAASPLKEDGSGYKDSIDENCWTPLDLSPALLPYPLDFVKEYTESKTLTEREILRIGNENENGLEVVSIACGLVGGKALTNDIPSSVPLLISQVGNDEIQYQILRFLELLAGKIPIVHVEDVARAHLFCAETPSVIGRFFCASSFVGSSEIAEYYHKNYPGFGIKQEHMEVPKIEIKWGSKKIEEQGFVYKNDMATILDESISYAIKQD